MKKVRIGIIGTGNIADSAHAPAIASVQSAELVSVLSRDKKVATDFLLKHNAVDGVAHTSLSSFVEDPRSELAIICSPDGLHFEQASACLQAGKHVLLEKPLAISEAEASRLVKLSEDNRLVLATGFHLRSHIGHLKLRDLVNAGEIGELRHVRAIWAFPQKDASNWRAKNKLTKWWSLSAVGSHCLDLTRWFARDMQEWLSVSSAIANNVWEGPHDETAVISGQLKSGPTIEVVSSVQFGPYNRIELFGSKGQAVCEGTMGRDGAGVIKVNDELLEFEPRIPFEEQLKNVIECVQKNQTPRADGVDGLRSVRDLLCFIK